MIPADIFSRRWKTKKGILKKQNTFCVTEVKP